MNEQMTEVTGLKLIDATLLELDKAPHELHMALLDELISRALDYKDQRTDDLADAQQHSEFLGSPRKDPRKRIRK